jgi:hypothetical protein
MKFAVVFPDDESRDLAEFYGDVQECFFHVSHQSLSPYEPTLQKMIIPSEDEVEFACPMGNEIVLKVTYFF